MSPSPFQSPSDKMSTPSPEPMVPIQAYVTGTGGGGVKQQTIVTPDGQPNVVVNYTAPIVAVVVRFVLAFLTTLGAILAAGMTTNIIPAEDFFELLWKCAGLSVASAVLTFLKDLGVLFTRLKEKFPLLDA